MRRARACLLRPAHAAALIALLASAPAGAGGRYALLVGANRGAPGETPLRYAGEDVRRVRAVLTTLGGFQPDDVVLLEEPRADQMRETLARLNARLRNDGDAALLLVFYSGHADAEALHLGETTLGWDELRDLTAGSAAAARLLVIDACRSGQATRVKGIAVDAPFLLPQQEVAEGFAVLSSATAGESAMESDAIEGSFFTHHLVAALRGVADADGDRQVSLGEAFRYTADRTVASSARTFAGVQHPTYLYDLKGKAEITLTRLEDRRALGALALAEAGQYLIRSRGPEGPLTVEANLGGADGRAVLLEPGPYFVQRRTADAIYEAIVEVRAGEALDFTRVDQTRVQYAQLVRKGGARAAALSVALLGGASSPPLADFSLTGAATLMASMELESLTLDAEIVVAHTDVVQPRIRSDLERYGLGLGARKVFDFGPLAFSAGLRGGGALFHERYDTERTAPDRMQVAPFLDAVARADWHLPFAVFVVVEGRGGVLGLQTKADGLVAVPQAALGVGLGRMW